jgi:hypothetical protein
VTFDSDNLNIPISVPENLESDISYNIFYTPNNGSGEYWKNRRGHPTASLYERGE